VPTVNGRVSVTFDDELQDARLYVHG